MSNPTATIPTAGIGAWQRPPLLAGAALALVGLGLAAGLWLKTASPDAVRAPVTARVHSAVQPGLNDGAQRDAAAPQAAVQRERAGDHATGADRPAPIRSHSARQASRAPISDAQRAYACADCGVVESVRSFRRKGESSGVGVAAGAVVGGLLGNQIGKGNGRTAMTVLGAVGGSLAGIEVEKQVRGETWHEVRVRMDDGSVRTVAQKSAPAAGARVVVQNSRLLHASPSNDPRIVTTAARP